MSGLFLFYINHISLLTRHTINFHLISIVTTRANVQIFSPIIEMFTVHIHRGQDRKESFTKYHNALPEKSDYLIDMKEKCIDGDKAA